MHVSAERAERNPPVVKKWYVQESDHDRRQRGVAHANTLPVKWQQYNREKFHRDSQPKCDSGSCAPAASQRGEGYQQQQHSDNIDVTAACYLNREQWVPGIRQNPVRSLPTTTQHIQQNENNRQIANYKCYFHRKDRLMNCCYGAEEKLSARWIWARYIRIVQRAGFGCVQPAERRVAGNDNIRVIAEPLHAAIPNISMNVIIYARGEPKTFNVPQPPQAQPNHH